MSDSRKPKKAWRFASLAIGLSVVLGLGYSFLFGPLFAWSAIKPGYDEQSHQRASVFFPRGTAQSRSYVSLDQWMNQVEQFVQLKFQHPIRIIVCASWTDCHRFMPLIRGEDLGAMTPEYGTVTYITPKVEQMRFDSGEFVRHELTHAVILQNSTWKSRFRFKLTPWLFEGLAVLAADQQAYGTKSDFIARAKDTDLWPLFESGRKTYPDMRFVYRAWQFFLKWLIATQGRSRFQDFLTKCMDNPDTGDANFRLIYGKDLKSAVQEWQVQLSIVDADRKCE